MDSSSSRQPVINAVAITVIVMCSIFIFWNMKTRRHRGSGDTMYSTSGEMIAAEIAKNVGKGNSVAIIGCKNPEFILGLDRDAMEEALQHAGVPIIGSEQLTPPGKTEDVYQFAQKYSSASAVVMFLQDILGPMPQLDPKGPKLIIIGGDPEWARTKCREGIASLVIARRPESHQSNGNPTTPREKFDAIFEVIRPEAAPAP